MEIRSSTLAPFFQSLETIFNKAFSQAAPRWPELAMLVNSSTESNVYGWMEQLPGFREWIGARTFHNVKSNGYTLVNKDWESSVQIQRNSIEDDTYGIYTPMVEYMAKNGAEHPDEQVYDLINNGFTATCWDGIAFFGQNHPLRTDENGVAVTFNNVTNLVLDHTNFGTVREALLQNLQGRGKRFMGGTPELTLVVGTGNEVIARKILESEKDDFGADNVYSKMGVKLHVSALVNDPAWIIMVTNNPIKPFIYQKRQDIEIRYPSPDDYEAKKTKMFDFMADYRAAFGYALPILAYGSTGQ